MEIPPAILLVAAVLAAPMKKRKELAMIATAFCASMDASGKIENWVTDNVIGILLTPTFQDVVESIVSNLSRNLDYEIKARETAKPMRVHLYNAGTDRVIGAATGFDMVQLLDDQLIVK